jgi:hypothetical protein
MNYFRWATKIVCFTAILAQVDAGEFIGVAGTHFTHNDSSFLYAGTNNYYK